jgi:transcriptional regulator with XRE-family HTH domain
MAIDIERLGFFNARFVQRMNEVGLTATQVAGKVHLTYEHIRKLMMGRSLPSHSALARLCFALGLNQRDMRQRVARDRMIFKFGDAAWSYWGVHPRAGQLHILFPLLDPKEQEIARLWIGAILEANKLKRES